MKIFKNVLLVLLLANPIYGFAQGSGSVGGGRFSEAQLKDFMGELVKFFNDPQSRVLFPEVKEWEAKNKLSFPDFVASIEPVVINGKVYGPYGEERDCVSKVLKSGKRIFECNQDKVPENTLQNQPLVYQVELHEIFVQAGIEQPTSPELPSTYEKSSRISNTENLSLVTYQKWVPKTDESSVSSVASVGIFCSETGGESDGTDQRTTVFVWRPNGDYFIAKHVIPNGELNWGLQQQQILTIRQLRHDQRMRKLAKLFSKQITTSVIARGNGTFFHDSSDYIRVAPGEDSARSFYFNHDGDGVQYWVSSTSDLKSMSTESITRNTSEFVIHLSYGEIGKNYSINKSLVCVANDWNYWETVPVEDILLNKNQTIFRQEKIKLHNMKKAVAHYKEEKRKIALSNKPQAH